LQVVVYYQETEPERRQVAAKLKRSQEISGVVEQAIVLFSRRTRIGAMATLANRKTSGNG
jgi:hypothetical protein